MQTIFCIRYMWKIKGDNSIKYKIVTDLAEGQTAFEDALKALPDLEKATREYLSEFDCSKLGVVDKIFDKEDLDNEENLG